MTGFSAAWLHLREDADHRARNAGVAAALAAHFRGQDAVSVVDLGCGTGANLRATASLLPDRQDWRLVDHDAALLAAARGALIAWADGHAEEGGALALQHGPRCINVRFERRDLARDLPAVLGAPADLVTAAALFDLVSPTWIEHLATLLGARALYAVLSYDGHEEWDPPHEADEAVRTAFCAHQRSDKGFGPAAGPAAAGLLAAALAGRGYAVVAGESPWRLDRRDAALMAELVEGIAAAVAETAAVPAPLLDAWRAARIEARACMIGHRDLFAAPPR